MDVRTGPSTQAKTSVWSAAASVEMIGASRCDAPKTGATPVARSKIDVPTPIALDRFRMMRTLLGHMGCDGTDVRFRPEQRGGPTLIRGLPVVG